MPVAPCNNGDELSGVVLQVQAMPPLNPDFICGICERAYSNSAALHLHLIGNEHQVKLAHPKTKQGRHTVSVTGKCVFSQTIGHLCTC